MSLVGRTFVFNSVVSSFASSGVVAENSSTTYFVDGNNEAYDDMELSNNIEYFNLVEGIYNTVYNGSWVSDAYKTITFTADPTQIMNVTDGTRYSLSDFENWLLNNAAEVLPTPYLTNDRELTALADAIREKLGITNSFVYPAGFIDSINSIINGKCFYDPNYPSLSYVYDKTCTSIKTSAFQDQRSLTSVSFSVCTTIGDFAFYRCASLTSVSFPNCNTIGGSAFYRCESLTSVSFPNCNTIGTSAFCSCSSLTSVSFPVCTTIGYNAFTNCSSLTSVSFPACTTIASNAFTGCLSLTSVSFPDCTTIHLGAFYRCVSLTSVSFPNCNTIGSSAFCSCTSLSMIYLAKNSVVTLLNSNAFGATGITPTTGSIKVPSNLVNAYKTATNWSYFKDRIFAI